MKIIFINECLLQLGPCHRWNGTQFHHKWLSVKFIISNVRSFCIVYSAYAAPFSFFFSLDPNYERMFSNLTRGMSFWDEKWADERQKKRNKINMFTTFSKRNMVGCCSIWHMREQYVWYMIKMCMIYLWFVSAGTLRIPFFSSFLLYSCNAKTMGTNIYRFSNANANCQSFNRWRWKLWE